MIAVLADCRVADTLTRNVEMAIERARRLNRSILVTLTEPVDLPFDPLAFLAFGSAALGDGVLWSQPRTGEMLVGAGAAFEFSAHGPSRFGEAAAAIRDIRDSIVGVDPAIPFPIVGGFAFDDAATESPIWSEFPSARFVVPRVGLQVTPEQSLLRVTGRVHPIDSAIAAADSMLTALESSRGWLVDRSPDWHQPGIVARISSPERIAWESSVATAVSLIRQDELSKVVLAREVRLLADGQFDPVQVLSRMRSDNGAAALFAMQTGRSWFLGASPERLVRLTGGHVDATCLAGSIAIGKSEVEQRELAEQLLASRKDREEHEIVVRSTMAALEEVCEEVSRLTGTPQVTTARSVQHLESPIWARLATAGTILDLVERLHPTPAVGGYPRDFARTVIRELENIDRGWYAGPFGWTDLNGSGEFAVAIRSALISGRGASLYAGSGIVADSNPADEYHETELKLQPMLSALGIM